MCGIAGVFAPGGVASRLDPSIRAMTAALEHRGPDGAGIWVDRQEGVAFGHRRLAVVDLSESSAQPMTSADGRYVAVFNGEIYNFQELRRHLEKCDYPFRSSGDTEVLVAAISRWGIEGALTEFNGMFAFAVWDSHRRTLSLARDRMGEKPLYYGRLGQAFVFASEIGALEKHPAGPGEIDPDALAAYMRYGYVPAPQSIYSHIRKLPPGSMLAVRGNGDAGEPTQYWRAQEPGAIGSRPDSPGTAEDAVKRLDWLVSDAVRMQTAADVPVGAFLSGGIDSSIVAAMMCRHSRRVRTFTIGFAEAAYNEAPFAAAVARHLGTEHTQLEVTAEEAMSVIPKLPEIYGEPFADSSQIPMCLLSRLARQHVTVALSGDGADELFGGYDRYAWTTLAWRVMRPVPFWMRQLAARTLTCAFASLIRGLAPKEPGRRADRIQRAGELFASRDAAEVYRKLISQWQDPEEALTHPGASVLDLANRIRASASGGLTQRMMGIDQVTYLPEDVLVKVDRASMAHGLETRAPFLDRRIVELASVLPTSWKIRKGQGKWVLRQVLKGYVPQGLCDRPKAGFAVPLREWIRGPMRGWAEELISERRLRAGGTFHPDPIRWKWHEHLSGARDWTAPLWTVLMFQAWREHRLRAKRPEPGSLVTAGLRE